MSNLRQASIIMRPLLLCFGLLLIFQSSSLAQNKPLKAFSFAEFFRMIEDEKDSTFTLKDAVIAYNPATDSSHISEVIYESLDSTFTVPLRKDTITIDKSIELNNVHFMTNAEGFSSGIFNVHFLKELTIVNSRNGLFSNCIFERIVNIKHNGDYSGEEQLAQYRYPSRLSFDQSNFKQGVDVASRDFQGDKIIPVQIELRNSSIHPVPTNRGYFTHSSFRADRITQLALQNCEFIGQGQINISAYDLTLFWLIGNTFHEQITNISSTLDEEGFIYEIRGNHFENILLTNMEFENPKITFDWDQVEKGISRQLTFTSEFFNTIGSDQYSDGEISEEFIDDYLNKYRVINRKTFKSDTKLMGSLYNKYKQEHDNEFANQVYVEIKDLETARLQYLYSQSPSFKGFFTWKVNQFLKVFSAYGTEPARAIIFSVYVIIAFALVYLFFPNHWDSHGKNRIMDRYRFFTKYMKKDSGIHEVYLDDKQSELMASEDFKGYMQQSEKEIPKFFISTALPLYRWSVAGTKTTSWLLSKVDVLKGKWSDTEPSKKSGKSFLLIAAFLIALTYDILIKMLNALMLSINTFTTLGFGEIPIKGLPRYLAIIQGFIGWFMLTIFSVSLISQLLN